MVGVPSLTYLAYIQCFNGAATHFFLNDNQRNYGGLILRVHRGCTLNSIHGDQSGFKSEGFHSQKCAEF